MVNFMLQLLKESQDHGTGDWVGPRVGLDVMEKRKVLPVLGFRPQIIQPVAYGKSTILVPGKERVDKFSHSQGSLHGRYVSGW